MTKTVKLCRSLGTVDCDRYGVKKLAAVEGGEVSVKEDVADAMCARKLAVPVEMKAVPAKSEVETTKKNEKAKD